MSTNKLVLRSVTQMMNDFQPSYVGILPLLLARCPTQQYAIEVGKISFERAEAVGDLRMRRQDPKQTEIFQVHQGSSTKAFTRVFNATQFIQSSLQDRDGYESMIAQVIEENNKFADERLLSGDGIAGSGMLNNGLLWSADSNYVLETSEELAFASSSNLGEFYSLMQSELDKADEADGEKLVMFYGADTITRVGGIMPGVDKPFMSVLNEARPDVSFAKVPTAALPASAGNGFIILTLPATKIHYTTLPRVENQGINEEKMYAWTNLLMGNTMVEVLQSKGVIRQPLTFAAS